MEHLDYYQIIGNPDQMADLTIGVTGLLKTVLSESEEQAIWEELEKWRLVRDVRGEEKLWWHDNDVIDHSSLEYIGNYYTWGVILKDGNFYGVIVQTKNTASSGLSVYVSKDLGLVCIDGFKDGVTEEHESHNSSEVSWEHDVTYYLERKEQ